MTRTHSQTKSLNEKYIYNKNNTSNRNHKNAVVKMLKMQFQLVIFCPFTHRALLVLKYYDFVNINGHKV